jgi:hypothetical protein
VNEESAVVDKEAVIVNERPSRRDRRPSGRRGQGRRGQSGQHKTVMAALIREDNALRSIFMQLSQMNSLKQRPFAGSGTEGGGSGRYTSVRIWTGDSILMRSCEGDIRVWRGALSTASGTRSCRARRQEAHRHWERTQGRRRYGCSLPRQQGVGADALPKPSTPC